MSSRTEEQIAADEQLTAAIEAVQNAYYTVEGVLTKYVVLAQRSYWDDDGDNVTAHYRLTMNNEVPVADLLGMTEYASTRLRHEIVSED